MYQPAPTITPIGNSEGMPCRIDGSEMSAQAIAAFDVALRDLRPRVAGMPLGKLLGAYRDSAPWYNTSGGYLSASTSEALGSVETSLRRGQGGIKLEVGQPELAKHIERVAAVAHGSCVEHIEWLEGACEERIEIREGRMLMPGRPGLGLSLSEQAAPWRVANLCR